MTVFLEDVYRWTYEPGISEIYFLKLLILQNNQPPPPPPIASRARAPAEQWWYCSLGKGKTGVGCCIYQFSLSLLFSPTYLFIVAWQRPILGPAGCPVRMASPKISSKSAVALLAATPLQDVLQIQTNRFVFRSPLVSVTSRFSPGFYSQWETKMIISKNSLINAVFFLVFFIKPDCLSSKDITYQSKSSPWVKKKYPCNLWNVP